MIKGIMMDYGGTIDTHGIHWAQVLWTMYQKNEMGVDKDLFYKAYVHGERALAINRIVFEHHRFYDVLYLKVKEQFAYLEGEGEHLDSEKINRIVDDCYGLVQDTIRKTAPIVESLSEKYPIVLVSNFYGNIEEVLREFKLTGYFQAVVESAKVGVRKPDPAIFALGLRELNLAASECAVVGDSYSKDMAPAMSLGCRGIWLNVMPWEPEITTRPVDAEITDLADLVESL